MYVIVTNKWSLHKMYIFLTILSNWEYDQNLILLG